MKARMNRTFSSRLLLAFTGILLGWTMHAADLAPAQVEFFEKHIRPVLAAECYECHSTAKKKGSLVLDTRDGLLTGGESGPALVSGQPDSSLLMRALRHTHPTLKMPKNGAKLDARILANFAEWIRQGAPDPRTGPATSSSPSASSAWADTLAFRRQWWSFQPLSQPAVPTPKNAAWSTNAIDRFLLAAMEQRGLAPGPDADPRTLFRRLAFALTGLPPKPQAVEEFASCFADPRRFIPTPVGARPSGRSVSLSERQHLMVAAAVDSLMSSPAFAERWARHWLDLVRYAETHGSEGDPEIPFAWRYRDYLIRAFNADVPADQLIREHIAGDLLSASQTRIHQADGLNESRLGLAHLRLNEHGFQPIDTLDDQVKSIENQIDVLGKAFQGLTIACARCHDHKFDPVSQRDYYALYGVLASGRPAQVQVDTPDVLNKNRAELLVLKAQIKSALADSWRDAIPQLIAQLTRGSSADPQLAALNQRIAKAESELTALEADARAKALALRSPSPPPGERAGVRGQNATNTPSSFPQPISRWSFDTDARDQLGSLHGELLGGATLRNGRLILDGKEAHVRTAPLARDLREKTLEAWVALANLDQQGGGVLSVETGNGVFFDSIVFAEKEPRKWVNGSNNFRRSRTLDGVAETTRPGELIHVAVVYRPDNSVAFYRNGVLYAPAFTPTGEDSALRTFAAAGSRVLLGRRHTGGGRAFLAGEIDEARLYDRALTTAEVAASFKAGPIGVSPEEVAKAMTPDQRAKQAALTAELKTARAELAAKSPSASEDALAAALKDAQGNIASPLHAWAKLGKLDGAAFAQGWADVTKNWRDQLAAAQQHNAQFKTEWDFADGDAAQWFTEGNSFALGSAPASGAVSRALAGNLLARTNAAPVPIGGAPIGAPGAGALPGDFTLEPTGDRVLKGLLPAAVSSHLLSEKHGGLLTSPRFKITTDFISVRAAGGKGAMVRVIVDNYPLGSNPIFPKAELTRDEPGWVRLDTAYRKGSWAYLEFGTADDLTRKLGKNSDPQGRSWFSAERVVFHDKDTLREEPLAPAALLEPRVSPPSPPGTGGEGRGEEGRSVDSNRAPLPNPLPARASQGEGAKVSVPANAIVLAQRYNDTLTAAVAAWREGKLTESQRAFLDFFLRRSLLPTTLAALPKAAPLITEYRRLEGEITAPRRAPGVLEAAAHDAPLMPRGDHLKPGDPVPRGFLEVLGTARFFSGSNGVMESGRDGRSAARPTTPPLHHSIIPSRPSGRLELARAIASPQNPLTARVMVNRVWHHLFGRGLVPTVDNFGRLGDQPTHPELLDHLAAQFIADGWSLKTLIRRLVTTRAYQLASEPTALSRERDAANDFLSHFRVRRLEAEAIRDTLLAVSGRLDAAQFGPPVGIGDRARRSIYVSIRRNNLSPFLEIFDAPKPFTTLGRRDATNVPAQSLAFLNDPFVIEAAKTWADQLLRQTPQADANTRIQLLFHAAFARPASADELAKSRAYLAALGPDANDPRAWQDFIQSLFNLKEFIYLR